MTLHGSKGLEFPMVFLYGMDKGRLPLEFGGGKSPASETETETEEERRLCYVGMTRAKEELILVCSQEPSRFLKELPEENTKWERADRTEDTQKDQSVQMSLFDFISPADKP